MTLLTDFCSQCGKMMLSFERHCIRLRRFSYSDHDSFHHPDQASTHHPRFHTDTMLAHWYCLIRKIMHTHLLKIQAVRRSQTLFQFAFVGLPLHPFDRDQEEDSAHLSSGGIEDRAAKELWKYVRIAFRSYFVFLKEPVPGMLQTFHWTRPVGMQ